MEKNRESRMASAFSWVELVIGAIISWIADKTLGSLLEAMKRRLNAKRDSIKKRSLLHELGESNMRVVARMLELDPAEMKFSMDMAVDNYGLLRGFFKAIAEVFLYVCHKPDCTCRVELAAAWKGQAA